MTGQLVLKSPNAYTDNAWQTVGLGFADVSYTRTGWLGVGGTGTDICDFWLANDKGDVSLRPGINGKAKVADAEIATATKPQEFNLPLADGFADNGGACYCKTQEGIVYVNAVLKSDTTREATSVGCVVGTLPAGFRPPNSVFTATLFDTGDMGGRILGRLAVRTNGQIVVANVTSSWDRCFGYIVFVAAS